jgi:hypothetical protein
MGHQAANFVQANYRGKAADTTGLNTDSGWAALQNNGWVQDVDTTFRVRLEIDETATADPAESPGGQLEARLNSGSYQDVTTTSSIVKAVSSSQFSDEDATTNLITGSGRTFDTGRGSHDGLVNNIPTLSNEHTEFEYALQIVSDDVSDEDTVNVRVKGLNSYTFTPVITVNIASSPQSTTVVAGSASADAKAVTAVPGNATRSVTEGSATGDGPAVGVLSEASRAVSAGDATGDAPSVTVQPGEAPRTVVAADAAGDAPAVTAVPGGATRSVVEGSAVGDAPAVTTIGGGGAPQSREVVEGSASGDAPVVAAVPGTAPRAVVAADADSDAPTVTRLPGTAPRIVVEATALADAAVAEPSHMLLVSAATALVGLPIARGLDLTYQHFNARGQKRGWDRLPEGQLTGTPMEDIIEDPEQTPIEEEQVKKKGGRRRR